jgi:hypothetical protein
MPPASNTEMAHIPLISPVAAATLQVANMMRLCKDLRIPVVHKVCTAAVKHEELVLGKAGERM